MRRITDGTSAEVGAPLSLLSALSPHAQLFGPPWCNAVGPSPDRFPKAESMRRGGLKE
jgi:hypothetical protein